MPFAVIWSDLHSASGKSAPSAIVPGHSFPSRKHGGCTLGGLGPCIGRCGILLRDRRGGSLHLRVSAGALAALANGRIRKLLRLDRGTDRHLLLVALELLLRQPQGRLHARGQ